MAEGHGTFFTGYEDIGLIPEDELEKLDELPNSIYVGQWHNSKPHGYGHQIWTEYNSMTLHLNSSMDLFNHPEQKISTSSYEGEFKHGVKHGQGTFTFADGSTYIGEFVDNSISGYGKYEYNSTSENHYFCIVYNGEFSEGEFHGQGRLERTVGDGIKVIYEGGFQNGKRHGFGSLDDQKTLYKGGWKQGKKHGVGEIQFRKSDIDGYSGYWEDGEYVKEI